MKHNNTTRIKDIFIKFFKIEPSASALLFCFLFLIVGSALYGATCFYFYMIGSQKIIIINYAFWKIGFYALIIPVFIFAFFSLYRISVYTRIYKNKITVDGCIRHTYTDFNYIRIIQYEYSFQNKKYINTIALTDSKSVRTKISGGMVKIQLNSRNPNESIISTFLL